MTKVLLTLLRVGGGESAPTCGFSNLYQKPKTGRLMFEIFRGAEMAPPPS